MSEDNQVREALQSVAPHPEVPADLLSGAKRRRARNHRRALAGTGVAAVVLFAGVMLPRLPIGGVGSATDSVVPASAQEERATDPEGGADVGVLGDEDGMASQAVNDKAYRVTEGVDVAVEASERLGWEAIVNSDGVNRVVSPSSIALSLAVAGEGAEGISAESVDRALGLDREVRLEAFDALRTSLNGYDTPPWALDLDIPPETPAVHQANRVVTVDTTAEQPFLDRLAPFHVLVEEIAFAHAQADLDNWVVEHTGGLIDRSGVVVTPNTEVVLQDALFFAAAWRVPFFEEAVLPFEGPDGPIDVDMLLGQPHARYASGRRWEAVRLDYDDALAADVILPAPGVAPSELTVEELDEAGRALDLAERESIPVTMPALDIEAKTDLTRALPDVELSNLNGIVPGGQAQEWAQQARLRVTLEGTVGAAVTEMAVATSEPLHELIVDRPYVFRVLDTRTGWPLFLAAIGDPSAG
ncbi:serpin family protein [Tessaracoccus caeni]|uniref:serpin family protein n=1 Tax=Tessaracoccus caeni TaxID=3031239 RepID=UPI0023DC2AC8|nr:serpin family protein [Tessaracoccus caeni]MDF1489221.1 serpin family protein [Tessaracoccus caeni]